MQGSGRMGKSMPRAVGIRHMPVVQEHVMQQRPSRHRAGIQTEVPGERIADPGYAHTMGQTRGMSMLDIPVHLLHPGMRQQVLHTFGKVRFGLGQKGGAGLLRMFPQGITAVRQQIPAGNRRGGRHEGAGKQLKDTGYRRMNSRCEQERNDSPQQGIA
ncbi:hypothetical protein D3C75_879800 [compost metagenome]